MILILGLQGSGKTTQAELLGKRLGCPAFSMGQLLRDFGDQEVRDLQAKGLIVPSNKATPILEAALSSHHANKDEIILDGFPRDQGQADWVISKLDDGAIKFTAVIHLLISRDEATRRLLARGRSDDNPEAIKIRFSEYDRSIGTILNHFKEHGYKVYEVDGNSDVDTVLARIESALGHGAKA